MEDLTTKVYLPSRGKFNPSHSEPIILDMMGFEEEKIAFGSSTEEAIDLVLQRCIKSPENFDVSQLTPQDRRFLLMKLRIHSYGDDYHIAYMTDTGREEQKISLDDMEIKELSDDFEIPSGKLPMSKHDVKIKVLTVGEIRRIDKYSREKSDKLGQPYTEIRYEALRAKRIDAVDGEHLDTNKALSFLKELKGRDLAYIDYLVDKIDFGYAATIDIVDKSGAERTVPVRMTGEFFRPRFDD